MADTWQADLVPLLRDEMVEQQPIERSVVAASLSIVPHEMRADVARLFRCFGVFAEDAVVPVVAITTLAPLLAEGGTPPPKPIHVRRALQQLLKANLLLGSIESGISVLCWDPTRNPTAPSPLLAPYEILPIIGMAGA